MPQGEKEISSIIGRISLLTFCAGLEGAALLCDSICAEKAIDSDTIVAVLGKIVSAYVGKFSMLFLVKNVLLTTWQSAA